jgi:glycosyltransferase involved in cell wall biosynthesis
MRQLVYEILKQPQRFYIAQMRRNWPPSPSFPDSSRRVNVAVVIVNWNTRDLLAALLFSLCRIVGREQITRIVVVDNNSTDGSRLLLKSLADAKLIDVVFNNHQRYHGPGLNDGIRFLERLQRNPTGPEDVTDYIWVLDSDIIILRDDVINDAIAAMRSSNSALCGQFQTNVMPDVIPEGYANICSIIFDPLKIWRRGFSPFEDHGAPALAMQRSLIRRRVNRLDFPFMARGYLIHLGRGSLRIVHEKQDRSNKYFAWAQGHWEYHYGDSNGRYLHEEFQTVFAKEVPDLSPKSFAEVCLRPQRIRLRRPYSIITD